LDEIRNLGSDTIHAVVYWGQYAPNPTSSRKPRGNSASPSFYSAGKWGVLDSLVRQSRDRGFSLILSPAGAANGSSRLKVPRWARHGTVPDITEFRRFVTALGVRYSGRYKDENGRILPRVSRWSIWNEPNIGGWLRPQWKRVRGKAIPYSAVIYRRLYNAGRGALASSGHGRDKIYLGEFAPLGRNRKGPTSPIAPGRFLREMACVDDRLRRYRGSDAKRRGCPAGKLRTSGIAHHLYTEGRGQGPTFKGGRDIFPVGNMAGLESLVRRLAARGRISGGIPFLNTEFGFQSNPPDSFSGVSLAQQAQYENESEYLEYKRPKWIAFAHYLMVDDRCGTPRCSGFQTGLKRNAVCGGQLCIKPAYAAYAMPVVVHRVGSRIYVWGADRIVGRGGIFQVLVNGNAVQTETATNPRGYFDVPVSAGGAGDSYQVRDVFTGAVSRVARLSSIR
jgi:hypothetical protein